MKSYFRRYLYSILGALTYIIIHEGVHIIQAKAFGVYEGIRVLPIGIEVLIAEPLRISGLKLASFSGLSSVITIIIGYTLFIFTPKILKLNKQPIKNYLYYATFAFLLIDPIYISLISFFVGGDINGISLGLNLSYITIRCIYFVIAIFNTYLVYKKLYPAYVIKQ